MNKAAPINFTANGAYSTSKSKGVHSIDYRPGKDSKHKLRINFPQFVGHLIHVPDRFLDLLEIASYIFAADRIAYRGPAEAVEYQSWARNISFSIRVRDVDFWTQEPVKRSLSAAIEFMTGDEAWKFSFIDGHSTPSTGLFDSSSYSLSEILPDSEIVLFSGGADSLAGALEILTSSKKRVLLVSHQSSNIATRTQRQLFKVLDREFPNRVHHFQFECKIKGGRPAEESQRSRAFLFSTIGFVLAYALEKNDFYIFENGITSINLRRREDLMNARASRTTHPTTLKLLSDFFSYFGKKPISIHAPFMINTKSDVMTKISQYNPDLLTSTVSCTQSFERGQSTHCGKCFQCVDRRIAVYAAGLQKLEHSGIYNFDLVKDVMDPPTKTVAIDYVRQALDIYNSGPDYLYEEYAAEIAELGEDFPIGLTETDKIENIWKLYSRHAADVKKAIETMRLEHDDPFSYQPLPDSFLSIVESREYLKPDNQRLLDSINLTLSIIGEMFTDERPKNENDLNRKVGVFLRSHDNRFRSEYPTVSFACAKVVPDHELETADIIVESKYIRSNTSPSTANEGIAADLTKYPKEKLILFVVYDPDHRIRSDSVFKSEIEDKGRNRVLIIR
jgi:7-cyano-7-deazaguanine synthase in queuosine biosynthesis